VLAVLQAYINLDDSILQRVKLLVPEHWEKPSDVIKVRALLMCSAAAACAFVRVTRV
jgi:hypothetical protein